MRKILALILLVMAIAVVGGCDLLGPPGATAPAVPAIPGAPATPVPSPDHPRFSPTMEIPPPR